jgi:hypothetical protein
MVRTNPCAAATKRGRLSKATQFLEAADVVATMADNEADVFDACVTLLVHAGIAASDALCCEQLGRHPQGQDHREAIELLATVDRGLAGDLRTLLDMKTKAGYSPTTMPATKYTRAARAARRLVETAVSRIS